MRYQADSSTGDYFALPLHAETLVQAKLTARSGQAVYTINAECGRAI